MLFQLQQTIHDFAGQIMRHEARLCARIGHDIHDEDDFTSRLADRIEQIIDGHVNGGFRWHAASRKFPWRGPNSEEKRYGGDLLITISVHSPDFSVSKGVLVQSKMSRDEQAKRSTKSLGDVDLDDRLREQMQKMLVMTPESFVWSYDRAGVSAFRAGNLLGCANNTVAAAAVREPLAVFMQEFLNCWHGDYRLSDTEANSVRAILDDMRVSHWLRIAAVGAVDGFRE